MDLLIRNARVLTFREDDIAVLKADIGVKDKKIRQIGSIGGHPVARHTIDAQDMLAIPGLINTHTHMPMTLFRNYADDLPLFEWLNDMIWPAEAKMGPEDAYWGTMLAMAESIRGGVTCFSDMYFFMEEIARAALDSGIRAYLGRAVVSHDDDGASTIAQVREIFEEYHGEDDNRLLAMVAPHAPYTCNVRTLEKVIRLSEDLDVGIHTHLSETKQEVEESLDKWGKTPIKHVHDLGLFDRPTVAAHCVHVTDEDLDIFVQKGVSVAHNPTSNLKLASGFAPLEKMLDLGINVALGTDGASSNNNLNMFEEMHLASIISKAVNEDASSIGAKEVVKMATINGAKALGAEGEIGSLEVGKRADIVLLDLKKPHHYPQMNLVASLVYSAQASDVHTTIVDGKILMENYELKTLDIEKIIYKAQRCAEKLTS